MAPPRGVAGPVQHLTVNVLGSFLLLQRRRFVGFNAIGAIGWSATMIVAGALLGGVPLVATHIELVSLALVALSIAPVVIAGVGARQDHRGPSGELTDEALTIRIVEPVA